MVNDYDSALENYDRGLEIDSNDAGLYNNKSWVLKKMSRFDEAIECQEKAIELNPSSHYLKNMAILYKELGDLDKAHEFYDKAYELDDSIESFEEIEN